MKKLILIALLGACSHAGALTNDEVNALIALDLAGYPSPCGNRVSIAQCEGIIAEFLEEGDPDDLAFYLDNVEETLEEATVAAAAKIVREQLKEVAHD